MKKNVLLFVIICLAVGASAQRIQFQKGKKINAQVTAQPQLVRFLEGSDYNRLFVVEPVLNPAKKTVAVKARICDMNWENQYEVRLDDTWHNNIASAFRKGSKLHLLLSYEDNDSATLRHVELSAGNLKILSDNKIINRSFDTDEKGSIKVADSPDGMRHCAVLATWNKTTGQSGSVAYLYDDDMNLLWQRDMKWGDVADVLVTNKGEVVTAALGYSTSGEKESIFRFNMADENGSHSGQLFDKPVLGNLALLNYSEGKVTATALMSESTRRFSFLGIKDDDKYYTGLYAICFDIKGNKLVSSDNHFFTRNEIRTFENAKGNDDVDTGTNFLGVVDYCATPQGGAVLINRSWVILNHGRTTNFELFTWGMLLFQVNMEGKITSASPLRHANCRVDWTPVVADLFYHNNKLYVVTNESNKESGSYSPNSTAKPPALLRVNSALAIYTVKPNGKVSKQMVERDKRAFLGSPLYKCRYDKFYFLSGNYIYPTKICYITIP